MRRELPNPDYSTVSGRAQGVGTRGRLTTPQIDSWRRFLHGSLYWWQNLSQAIQELMPIR